MPLSGNDHITAGMNEGVSTYLFSTFESYKQPNIIKMIIIAPATKSWSFIAIRILKAIQTNVPYSSIRIALVINQGEQSIRN